jgi:hypothetical protein
MAPISNAIRHCGRITRYASLMPIAGSVDVRCLRSYAVQLQHLESSPLLEGFDGLRAKVEAAEEKAG